MIDVLKLIKPTRKEELDVRKISNNVIKKIRIKGAKPILGGSGAKGTWLKDGYDIDIYVLFDFSKYHEKDISKLLYNELRKRFKKVKKLHGSRDYYQINIKRYTVEIVPIIGIKNASQALNITDISPLHTLWVRKHNIGDEIRLAKAFCVAQGCYGAESYIQGFSGYVLEILTVYYGTFNSLIKNAAKWAQKTVIDIENHGTTLNKAKTVSPLIVIDPVQPDRNAAAALSMEKYNLLIDAAKKYLKTPSADFFIRKELTPSQLKQAHRNLVALHVTPLNGKEDVVGAKILKLFNHLKKCLTMEGFKVLDCSWSWNKKALLWYSIDVALLPEYKEHIGPKLGIKNHVDAFKRKYSQHKLVEKSGRIIAVIPRKYQAAGDFIMHLIKTDSQIQQWCKRIVIAR